MKNKKMLTIAEYELPVALHEEDGVFIAQCTKWQDCYAQGNTLEEAINEVNYVASSLIELYQEEGIKIPLKLKSSSEKSSSNINLTFPLIISTNWFSVMKPLPYRLIIKKLRKSGFAFRRATGGSHEIWWNEKTRRTCVIPRHKEIKVGTLKSIIRQAGISEKELNELA